MLRRPRSGRLEACLARGPLAPLRDRDHLLKAIAAKP
jgi:hypothetical protein